MSTLQQIRDLFYSLLAETEGASHVSAADANRFINIAQKYLAVFAEYPRDMVEASVSDDSLIYTLPSDFVNLLSVYFGDKSVANDMVRLKIIHESTLKNLYPGWLDETSNTRGEPKFAILLHGKDLITYPRADTAHIGKTLYIDYVYVPASMAEDIDTPDLPLAYHDLLAYYALHLAYIKMQDMEKANQMMGIFLNLVKQVKPMLDKESDETLQFQFVNTEDFEDTGGEISP